MKEVQIDLAPEEPASAKLFDAQGRLVAEMPFQTRIHRRTRIHQMKVKCSPKADEIWTLQIPKADEDLSFQVGARDIREGNGRHRAGASGRSHLPA